MLQYREHLTGLLLSKGDLLKNGLGQRKSSPISNNDQKQVSNEDYRIPYQNTLQHPVTYIFGNSSGKDDVCSQNIFELISLFYH